MRRCGADRIQGRVHLARQPVQGLSDGVRFMPGNVLGNGFPVELTPRLLQPACEMLGLPEDVSRKGNRRFHTKGIT